MLSAAFTMQSTVFSVKILNFASEEVILELITTKCMPILLYGLESCQLAYVTAICIFWIFAARCPYAMHKRGYIAVMRCPSVRLYDTFVSCAKTNKDIFEFFSPPGSHTILTFRHQTGWRFFDGTPPP